MKKLILGIAKMETKRFSAKAICCFLIFFSFSISSLLADDADEFVVASSNRLILKDSGKGYYFSSTNQYYLFYEPLSIVDEFFDEAAAMGINAIRTWGFCDGVYKNSFSFQPVARTYDQSGFERMDYLIQKARASGIRLIIPFVNNWGGMPNFGGMDAYVRWSTTGATTHDDFYTDEDCRAIYKDYVAYFLNRVNTLTGIAYKDDPTILMWELANEPRCQSDPSGHKLQAWIDEMAAYIKSIDSNHLLSTGMEGWYNRGTGNWKYDGSEGTDFIRNNQSPYIDICSFHMLYDGNGFNEYSAMQWIKEHVYDAHYKIGKPVYCGEFGFAVYRELSNAEEMMAKRNYLYAEWYAEFLENLIDGGGFWLLGADISPDDDHHTVYYPGDTETCSIITDFSSAITGRNVLYVSSSGYASISAAMTAARPRDIVLVEEGTYNESFTMRDGITLLAMGKPESTIINGGVVINNLYSSGLPAAIEGFTITNPSGEGINSNSLYPVVISGNIIKDCLYRGITAHRDARICNNIIKGNTGGGIYSKGGNVKILNNVIVDNRAIMAEPYDRGGGIYILLSSGKILNNIIVDNNALNHGGGIKGWSLRPEFEIGYNDVWNNKGFGGQDDYGTCPTGDGAISEDPQFSDAEYHLSPSSPCINAGSPSPEYRDVIDYTYNDMGIYGGSTPFDAYAYILNMTRMVGYANVPLYSSTGAAVCQTILNYIRDGAGEPLLTQDEIYEYERDILRYGFELTPDEVDKVLGHFDPYDYLVSNSYDSYDSLPDGNPFQGYNYTVDTYDPTTDPEAISHYMRDICHWMAYTVTQENWRDDGELVARPNTPAAIPMYGSYDNWVAVKGFIASENPCPEPHTNPWNTPDFTVYGFWIMDPQITGMGQNTYKTAAECESVYFKPLTTGDVYDGLFLQVAEPPAEMSDANIEIPTPAPDLANLEFVGAEPVTDNDASDAAEMSSGDSPEKEKSPIEKKSWRDLIDPYLLTDSEAVAAFEDTHPQTPIFVHRLDKPDKDYYLVPYNKEEEIVDTGYGQATSYGISYWENTGYGIRHSDLTSAVMILDASEGYFKEAAWSTEPIQYSIMSEEEAIELVKKYMWKTQEKLYKELLARYGIYDSNPIYQYIMLYFKGTFWRRYDYLDIQTRLVWTPGEYSSSPYNPFWEIVIGSETWYITQEWKKGTDN